MEVTKELEALVDDLKQYLSAKAIELNKLPNFNSHTDGSLLNRQRDIEGFEAASKNVEANPFNKSEIIRNFQRDADIIKRRIDEISS